MDLESIPGVGTKTAEALSTLEDPAQALARGDVAALSQAPEITPGRAAAIARAAIRAEHDDPGGFLATSRARAIYEDLLALLKERAVTDYAARRLETFYPSSTRSRIDEIRTFTRSALEHDPDPAVRAALEGVEPLSEPADVTVRDRCLATADADRYATAREAFPELSVEIVEDTRGLAELARGYATVVALDERFAGVDVDGDVQVRPDALEAPVEVVPERSLSFFAANRAPLRAAIAVHRAADLESPCELASLEEGLDRLDDAGEVAGDDALDRLSTALDDLTAAVETAESVANDRLREAIEERDVTIEGADLLSLVERGAGVDSLLSRELADEYAAAVEAARDHLADALDLDSGETELARRVFGDEPTFPVSRDEDAVSRLRDALSTAKERRAARLKRDLAGELDGYRADAERLVRAALELDVELAIARFAADYDCTLPTFVDPNEQPIGFEIVGGRSPLLSEPPEAVEAVDYAVSDVRLLSGVNSGGKTSTLDLVASVVILGHMGLVVPADAVRLRRFDDLHYHAKSQGTLDAGAFESTVREFAALTAGGDGSLVLVDELESITEPGASAKIIAGICEALDEQGSTAVFVSHLAREIREVAAEPIAVDGIEAVGLVDGTLEVNRSPKPDHLARSTPELIVEKLATEAADSEDASERTTHGPVEFYERLLEKFE